MLRNHLKTALRSIFKNKLYSIINIAGLSVGMAATLLIGLWIWDELSYNTYHTNYRQIAQVMENQSLDKGIEPLDVKPMPLAEELRRKFPGDFKFVVATTPSLQIVANGDKKLTKVGSFAEPDFPEMMTLKMISGTRDALKDPASILISQSLATSIFGNTDPIDKIIKL